MEILEPYYGRVDDLEAMLLDVEEAFQHSELRFELYVQEPSSLLTSSCDGIFSCHAGTPFIGGW